jgi:predicted phosphodiesterase
VNIVVAAVAAVVAVVVVNERRRRADRSRLEEVAEVVVVGIDGNAVVAVKAGGRGVMMGITEVGEGVGSIPLMMTSTSEGEGGRGAGVGGWSRAAFLRVVSGGVVAAERVGASGLGGGVLRFGVLTDCQYADVDTPAGSKRLYRRSPQKLADAIAHCNAMGDLEFLLHLGDAVDRGERSYDVVRPIFRSSVVPVHHVAGNHDYEIASHLKAQVPMLLGMPAAHYRIERGGWRLLMLDGNAVSTFAWPEGSVERREAEGMVAASSGRLAGYNGAMGAKQLEWLRVELESAREAGVRCLLCCHYPVWPVDGHVLWDAEAVVEVLRPWRGVVAAWFNGHNHAGNYAVRDGIHFLNFKGMVEEESNSYARVECYADRIEVTGFGREVSRVLRIGAGG